MESTQTPENKSKNQRENPFLSLAFNIFLPVFVLQKGSKYLGEDGPFWALIIALAFPIVYGALDYIKRRHKNYISVIGIISVLFTGGLALFQADGIWFALVEMGLPLILGIGVFVSAFSDKPFIATMAYNDMLMQTDRVEQALQQKNNETPFKSLLKNSTFLLASSFLLSAILNFGLAYVIFSPIDPSLAEAQRAEILNNQIAEMRYKSVFVIMIPLMLFSVGIMWHLLNGIKKLTSLDMEDILKTQ